ncbi:glycosyltransferase [Myxosarcina sp. GI1]|uniref:glycosyltransferase n=1 Tax=Myxosarcina sp. GI1 TaxID=1541065 RepID=UPI00056C24A9|nr:glycosyltransferase [Myxosarcina sp. GI1]
MNTFSTIIACLSLIIWLFLILFWGKFWLADRRINLDNTKLESYPAIWAIIPARNEADVLPISLPSLLNQDYVGSFSIALVDDQSTDDTTKVAKKTASALQQTEKINIISGKPLPNNWKGKLWAVKQGIDFANEQTPAPDYFLLTDADIKHDRHNLTQLVTKAETEHLDLVSLMVLLRCKSFWEKLLIPAFVFFFQKLYPFSLVNNPNSSIAAAAGGCILIRRQALENIGGIEAIAQALIDDCALAKAIKFNSDKKNKIWLGLTETTTSLRAYEDLKTIWDTIARTAFTQLNYSALLLIGTVLGMLLVYLVPPISIILGLAIHNYSFAIVGLLTWLLMTVAYLPTVKLYQISFFWALCLPAITFLYTLMTIDSAIKHWQGKGGSWKGRTYSKKVANSK